jgi:1-acyl-sn-glycerol-3-phosphate acyltransferase
MTQRYSPAWYDFNWCLLMAGFTLGFSLKSIGSRNMPRTGPVLVVSNHQSFIDPLLVGLAVRRRLCYLARKTLFRNRYFGAYLRSVNCVPVDQEGVAKEGLKAVLERLKEGEPVLIFPEGSRTETGEMQPLRPGVQLLVQRGKAPVLPVGIAGAFEVYPRKAKAPTLAPLFLRAPRGGVAVSVGEPLGADELAALPREKLLQTLFDAVQVEQRKAAALRRKAER